MHRHREHQKRDNVPGHHFDVSRWLIPACALLVALTPRINVTADEPATDRLAERRLELMMEAFNECVIEIGDDRERSKVHPEPLLRWNNPLGQDNDGVFVVFVQEEERRPDVVGQFGIQPPQTSYFELSAVRSGPFRLSRNRIVEWQPTKRWSEFHVLTEAPEPAATKTLRLSQMRKLAAEFQVTDEFGWNADATEAHRLRLLRQPVYRWGGSDNVIDGALFVYSLGTDPETVLLIEAIEAGDRRLWQYKLVAMSIYALEVEHRGSVVWTKPRTQGTLTPGDPFFAVNYRIGSGSLDSLFPSVD